MLSCDVFCFPVLCCVVMFGDILCYVVLCCIVFCCTVLYCVFPCYVILQYSVVWCNMKQSSGVMRYNTERIDVMSYS